MLCQVENLNPVDHNLIFLRSPRLTDALCKILRCVLQGGLVPFDINTISKSTRSTNDSVDITTMRKQWVAEILSDAMELSYRLPLVHEKLTNSALSFFDG